MISDSLVKRIKKANDDGVQNNILFIVGGGLGDRVCAEPTLRYAIDNFFGVEISLACDTPELFKHLRFKKIYDLKSSFPLADNYLSLYTYPKGMEVNQYLNPNMVHCVDYASLSAIRMMLQPKDKRVFIQADRPSNEDLLIVMDSPEYVVLHPGNGWPSKSIPSSWWEHLIAIMRKARLYPIIVGDNTVDVRTDYGMDLRGKLSLNDFAWLCMNAHAVVTNDSSPVHLAASGTSMIAYIPTAKRPDLITHFRRGGFGWKQMYFCGHEKMWEKFDQCPNTLNEVRIDQIPEGYEWKDFLPHPNRIVEWITTE